MERINNECYVSLEVAKLLKKAGFDWECRCYYPGNFLKSQYNGYPKPTLDIVQKWLREVKRIHVEVLYLFEPYNHYFTRACYLDANTPLYITISTNSTIYEEAYEAGIKKALEIILEK
jgi:hypothetical protein